MTHRTLPQLALLCSLVLASFTLTTPSLSASPQGTPVYGPTEVGPNAWRRNYASFKAKIDAGETVRVGFMGGSISRGASTFPWTGTNPDGSTYDISPTGPAPYYSERHSMRATFHQNLQAEFGQYPGQIRMLNLALGGSDSYEAAFRYKLNAASRDLDMLVLEFAVNDIWHARNSFDNPTQDFALVRMLECIVRQAFHYNPDIAILFVISTARNYYSDFDNPDGFMTGLEQSRQLHRSFAISRSLPYVDMTDVFYNGTVPDYVKLYQGEFHGHNRVHMSPTGHRIAGEAVFRVARTCINNGFFDFGQAPVTLPAQLDPWPMNPRIMVPAQLPLTTDYQIEQTGEPVHATPIFGDMQAARATQPRSMLDIPFQGETIGLWWQNFFDQEKGNGRIGIWLDGVFQGSYFRGSLSMPGDSGWPRVQHIGFGLDPNVPHLLQIGVLADQPEDMRIALLGVLVGG